MSNSERPSTSRSPLASIAPVNVDIPVTFQFTLTSPEPVISKLVPSKVKLALSSRAPEVPTITTLLSVRSEILAEEAVRSVPSNVRLPLSSSSPPVPAITIRLSVKSSTLNVFACPPPLISTKPTNVDIPET